MSILTIVLNIVFGFISGIFGGLGMGGGTLLIPLLTIFLQVEQKLAQGVNLLAFLAMSIASLIIHYKNGYVKAKGTIFIIVFGVIFSLLGSFIVHYVQPDLLRRFFGVFLCVLSLFQIIKIAKK